MISVPAILLQFKTALHPPSLLISFSAGALFLFIYIYAQRAWQRFREQRYDALSFKMHGQWRAIVKGDIRAEEWSSDSIQLQILQSILIQEIAMGMDKERAELQKFLRDSGLVSRCIERVLNGRGPLKRRAMLELGSMRIPDGIAALTEGLDDWQLDTRLAAVKALGRTGLSEAAEPIIEAYMVGNLKVPPGPIANALIHCYANHPEALLPYLRRSLGGPRDLIARVVGELATPAMADEILILADDARPEIRACAARAAAALPLSLGIPMLARLVRDDTWFVRLRATASLNQIFHPRVIPILLEAIRDSHRLVRLRSATALAKFDHETLDILRNIVESRDQYALHAMISVLETGGGFGNILAQLADPDRHDKAAAGLLEALRKGSAGVWSMKPADPVVEAVFP